MKVVHAKPPLYEEILAAFPMASKPGVMFTWGPTIYVPHGGAVSPYLYAHEGVHAARQGEATRGIEDWWRRYLVDAHFRLDEEVHAHRAEYHAFCNANRDRNARARYLHAVAGRLAGPLYGNLLQHGTARSILEFR